MASVVIIGAGPAGATLAYLLVTRGIDVTLIERQKDFAREFRGEALMPSGVAALDEAGLQGVLQSTPLSRPNAVEINIHTRRALRVDFGELAQGGPVIVSQPDLLEALVAACTQHEGFRILRGTAVRDLIFDSERVVGVTTADGEEVRADLVVGADGRTSIARRRAGLHLESSTEQFDIVWFKLPYPAFLEERGSPVNFCVGAGHLALCYRAANGLMQMGSVIAKGSYGDLKRRGLDLFFDELVSDLTPELGRYVSAKRNEIQYPFVLDVVCHMLPKWTTPGVLLLGDAAHPMSPVGGQGINIALRDVIVATNHLVPVLQDGATPERIDLAACAFEAARRPEVAEVQRLQRIPPRILFRNAWWSEGLLSLGAALARSGLVRPGRRLPAVVNTFLNGRGDVRLVV
jgi:2-polyprenyl-6-methoxyphenol hydroxylase-like FAD-dependent oxidoreductase